MNNSISRFNFDANTPHSIDEDLTIPVLIAPSDRMNMVLVNDQFKASKQQNNKKPKRSITGIIISILLFLNIIAIVAVYFRNEIVITSFFESEIKTSAQRHTSAAFSQQESPTEVADYSHIVSDVLTDIAEVESARVESARKNYSSAKETLSKAYTKQITAIANKPTRKTISKSAVSSPLKPITTGVSGSGIRNILNTFAQVYSSGHTDKLLNLFIHKNAPRKWLLQIQNNAQILFAKSIRRQVSFDNMIWQYQNDRAIGQGKYHANVDLTHRNAQQAINADIQITIQKEQNQYVITDFQLSNAKTSVSANNFPSLPLDLTTSATIAPSRAELQQLLASYIRAYENGDIKQIKSLFAQNAITNTHIGLQEITQDYTELFQGSSDRKMFINNLVWVYHNNHAKGSGNLDVFITANDAEIDHAIKGKIKIIAKRIQNSIVITHLYHSESK